MMEAIYEAEEARQLEENRTRVLANAGDSEEYKEDSQRGTDDCPGAYDTVSSDVRAAGDGPDSDLPLAVEMDDGSSRPAPHSGMNYQAASSSLVPSASLSPTHGDGSVDEIIELSSTGSVETFSPPPGHNPRQ